MPQRRQWSIGECRRHRCGAQRKFLASWRPFLLFPMVSIYKNLFTCAGRRSSFVRIYLLEHQPVQFLNFFYQAQVCVQSCMRIFAGLIKPRVDFLICLEFFKSPVHIRVKEQRRYGKRRRRGSSQWRMLHAVSRFQSQQREAFSFSNQLLTNVCGTAKKTK